MKSFRDRVRGVLVDFIRESPPPGESPSQPLVEALYRLRRTLATVEQRDALRAVEAVLYRSEADALRAKEQADHKAWLRENAESVTVPEHPAVALLREREWSRRIDGEGYRCPECDARQFCADGAPGKHAPDCRLAVILAGSTPGERALSEVLAEARSEGYDEALQSSDAGGILSDIRARGQR